MLVDEGNLKIKTVKSSDTWKRPWRITKSVVCEPTPFPVQVAQVCEGENAAELGAAPQLVLLFSSGEGRSLHMCFLGRVCDRDLRK